MRTITGFRRLLAAAVVATALSGAASVAARTAVDVTISGSGWGHGVGLSQYGAKAMGLDGATHQEIVYRYFPETNLALVGAASPGTFLDTDPTPLWVGLLQNVNSVSFEVSEGGAWLCFDRNGGCVTVAQAGETWRFVPDGTGNCLYLRVLASGSTSHLRHLGSCEASVRPLSPTTTTKIPVKARSYRYGVLRFRPGPRSQGIHAVYEIGIEDYMKGLSAVPESWPPAAIRAQAVVSRSYALRTALGQGGEEDLKARGGSDCYCNLRDDASDQVFRGWSGETSHPNWVAAVDSTSRLVLVHAGEIALGSYSSSSGGMTESYADVFGGNGYPYLVSVDDSPAFSQLAENPHATWAAGYDQATLAMVFDFSWLSDIKVVDRNESGSARTIRLVGIVDGSRTEKTMTGVELRTALSLRSTTFDIFVSPRFTDVAVSHVFAGEVLGLHEMGITQGCTATAFCPGRTVTRGEMAAFLVRALGLTSPSDDPFTDDDNNFFESDIEALHASGITEGCTATAFCPGRAVTRGEMAAFLVRALDGLS